MGGKDIEISQNDVSASGYASLQISQYDNVTIDNNTAEDGDYYGLTIGMCNDTIISGNRILNNGDDGIRIDNGNRTTCSGNVVFGNNYIGFEIVLTGNCTIVENVISENAVAAFVWMSDNVTVHHNYIFGLAWDLDSKNISWDNGYPLGGNYWTVYTGTDLFSGPNQDIPGGDGMGDTPYAVDADSQDHYPLMNSPMADHDPPFTSFEWSGGSRTNGWNTSPIMVWLNASDSGIGVASTYFRLGGPVGLWDEYTGPFTVSWNCNTTLEYRSVDYLINQEITRSATIRVDISPPYTIRAINCTDGEHGWCRSAATMELIGIDSGSGINWTKCSIDGNSWNEYNSPFILSSEGKHLVEFYSQDNAGHTEDVGNCSIWIDTLAPNLEIAVDNGTVFQQGAVYISWNASDVTSGIDARYHWYLTSPGYNYDLITNTTTLNLSAYAAGRYNLTIQAFDMAGNVAERTISFEISSSMTSNSFDLTWVIVILTIGILVGISVPKIFGMRKKAKESDVRAAVKDTAAGKAQLYDDYKPKEPGPPGDAKQK
jgi:parallel beta-helix repeat protein